MSVLTGLSLGLGGTAMVGFAGLWIRVQQIGGTVNWLSTKHPLVIPGRPPAVHVGANVVVAEPAPTYTIVGHHSMFIPIPNQDNGEREAAVEREFLVGRGVDDVIVVLQGFGFAFGSLEFRPETPGDPDPDSPREVISDVDDHHFGFEVLSVRAERVDELKWRAHLTMYLSDQSNSNSWAGFARVEAIMLRAMR